MEEGRVPCDKIGTCIDMNSFHSSRRWDSMGFHGIPWDWIHWIDLIHWIDWIDLIDLIDLIDRRDRVR